METGNLAPPSETQYVYDNAWSQARERLAALEVHYDPTTIRNLETIGIREGWHCLEVGAGGGSIAEWLCGRVGSTGRVVAIDLDTRFIDRGYRGAQPHGGSIETGRMDFVGGV